MFVNEVLKQPRVHGSYKRVEGMTDKRIVQDIAEGCGEGLALQRFFLTKKKKVTMKKNTPCRSVEGEGARTNEQKRRRKKRECGKKKRGEKRKKKKGME